MNYQIADAKTRYFENKEHYLNFRKAWSESVNNDDIYLSGAHMLLYSLLRERDVREAFTPTSRPTKLRSGQLINNGLYRAYESLSRLNGNWVTESDFEYLMLPFKDTLKKETLMQAVIDMPKISPIYGNYGKGIQIAETIIESEERSSEKLWNIIEEAA